MPGKTVWVRASAMNARRRSTTCTPIDAADDAEQHGLDQGALHEAGLERLDQEAHGRSPGQCVVGDDGAVADQGQRVRAVGLAQVVGRERVPHGAERDLVAVQQAGLVAGHVRDGEVVGRHHDGHAGRRAARPARRAAAPGWCRRRR